jgi:transposase
MLDVIPLIIHCLRLADGQLLLEAEGARERVQCPSCGAESDQVHGHYQRSPLDLPWRGQPVRVSLRVRRFRCLVPECERQTFAEAFRGSPPGKHAARRPLPPSSLKSPSRWVGRLEHGWREQRACR